MPELPDLTVFSQNLSVKLRGKKVRAINYHKDKRLNVSQGELSNVIAGNVIDDIRRSGKEVEFVFSNKATILVHLMLSGGFSITDVPATVKFRVLTIEFYDNASLVVADPKGLVTVNLNPAPPNVLDALEINGDYLRKKALDKPKALAKAFLIDQSIVRGIGNAYADEILWQARVSPKSIIGNIPDQIIDDLAKSITLVLTDAIEKIKASNPTIMSGEIRDFLVIHNPDKERSPTGHEVIKEQIASKTTYYTDEQVLYV